MIDYRMPILAVIVVVFGVILYFLLTFKRVKKQNKKGDVQGKPVFRSGGANHFMNGEAVGGNFTY